jgi:hypothetical protein
VSRLRLASVSQAVRYFGQYSEALEKKYAERSNLFRRPNFFSFDSPDGGVYLSCVNTDCLSVEGTDRAFLDSVNKALGWPAAPPPPLDVDTPSKTTTTHIPENSLVLAGSRD